MSIAVGHDEGTKWDWPFQKGDGVVKVLDYEDHFEVGLEAHNFQPNEIDVKNIGEFLEIHMAHTTKDDKFGSITRSITRCYRLPKGTDPSTIKSSLDGSGILHITGNKKK
uniref:SHSP domain-containing protein n=1 Tax=Caenorhabditis tropicalis TaxID=1561998 RepID=A0A1I7UDC1_9PELO